MNKEEKHGITTLLKKQLGMLAKISLTIACMELELENAIETLKGDNNDNDKSK